VTTIARHDGHAKGTGPKGTNGHAARDAHSYGRVNQSGNYRFGPQPATVLTSHS